ncbi:hypothetical protein BK120_22865 [Paenibacillus sp. FSL A5-0031]|uniref:hypothetical protein n=1 Tax=Paenibacillus sp. FSL A5-0031 TaxID=1920420 RepID=UPI00096CBF94|nr:hypothetical protein [Paenibacillus sp. FSL A5-0031]OME78583.1 hypothetical protein BK120_22865 [Paenibacillus sp. FSL A5-0031]
MRNRSRNEKIKLVGVFIGLILISIFAFYLLAVLLVPEGDEGMIVVISLVISLQISFITAYVITNSKK